MNDAPRIFAEWAPVYGERGFWSRPVSPNTKACPSDTAAAIQHSTRGDLK